MLLNFRPFSIGDINIIFSNRQTAVDLKIEDCFQDFIVQATLFSHILAEVRPFRGSNPLNHMAAQRIREEQRLIFFILPQEMAERIAESHLEAVCDGRSGIDSVELSSIGEVLRLNVLNYNA